MLIKCSFNALFENYLKITLVDNLLFCFNKHLCKSLARAAPMSH